MFHVSASFALVLLAVILRVDAQPVRFLLNAPRAAEAPCGLRERGFALLLRCPISF
jgi:hypothetical protein